jgi:hypothetical protein
LVFAVVVGFLMIYFLVAHSFRRFKSTIPLAGSCSAAISAVCHPPKNDTDTAALGQLAWGETDPPPDWVIDQSGDDDHEGHCSFTSLDAVQPSSTKLYAKLISNYLFLVSEFIFLLLADKLLGYFLILCVGNVLYNIRFQHPTVLQTEHRDYTLLRDKRDQSCITVVS